ncbi:hypothetical protein AX16_010705 [Volvariella volvacea WC 439]|nr:hypothetical protein AX16_010705 [Volvariella volvacea WC 439]
MIYDLTTTVLTVIFLLRYKFSASISSVISHLTKMMLYDGLGYFIVLTGVNVLNLILYRSAHDIQTAAASLGYCVTWIMSQRLLVHLYHASREHSQSIDAAITITHHLNSARDVSRAIRTQFENKRAGGTTFEVAAPDGDSDFSPEYPDRTNVQVRIERTVKLEHRSRAYELETYTRNATTSLDQGTRSQK